MRADSDHIISMVQIKRSAAIANFLGKRINAEMKDAIVKACDLIISGKYQDHFMIDVYQAGESTENLSAVYPRHDGLMIRSRHRLRR